MKTLVVVLLLAAAALGGWGVYQQKQTSRTQSQLAEITRKLKSAEAQLAEQATAAEQAALAERKAKVLQETLSQASEVSAKQSEQVSALEQSLAAAKTNSGGFASLFKNPEMKELIKAQQKTVMAPLIDKNYAAFFKQLNLTPEQSAHVKELLQKKMMVAAEMGMSLLDGSADAARRKEIGQQIKTETDAIDQSLKEYLGADNYKAFESYEKSVPDRMSLDQFKGQLSGSAAALDATQEEQLIQAMQEARTGYKWTTDFNNKSPGDANFAELFNEEKLAMHAREQEDCDQQLLQRVGSFMKPEQVTQFQEFLTNRRNMQTAAMKMAARMFGAQAK